MLFVLRFLSFQIYVIEKLFKVTLHFLCCALVVVCCFLNIMVTCPMPFHDILVDGTPSQEKGFMIE